MPVPLLPSPLVELAEPVFAERGLRLWLKRDDLIHPRVTGNKWRKLKYNLRAAREQGARTLLTFGGAYSNHLRAVAAAGAYLGVHTVGVVRGEEHLPLNESLARAVADGMRLTYLDRTAYRAKHTAAVLDPLRAEFGDCWLIPEGGSNALALPGCAELVGELRGQLEPWPETGLVCCPCGTGGTLAGIAGALGPGWRALGFSVLRGGGFLNETVAALQREATGKVSGNWSIELDAHFGGYARTTPELTGFADRFTARHGVELDRIYVAKMLCGLYRLAQRGELAPGTAVVAVITG